MKTCRHAAYCENAPHRCREFLGNPLIFIVGGCPLAPLDVNPEDFRGALSLAPAQGGELSQVEEAP